MVGGIPVFATDGPDQSSLAAWNAFAVGYV